MSFNVALMASAGGGALVRLAPRTQSYCPTVRAEIHFSAHRLRFRVVRQPQAELAVDLGFVGGVGVASAGSTFPRACTSVVISAWVIRCDAVGVEGCPVALRFRVAVGDGPAGGGDGGGWVVARLGVCH
ncbi:hypothetical protein [Micromonospora tulbaghiae]|uniref:hypothetical protein n=1 Tax=Micromonospora tulbaghiae TaxID=479978 RepID=UPI0036B29FDD